MLVGVIAERYNLFFMLSGYAFPYYTQTSVEAVPEYVKLVMALSTSMESTAVDIQLLPNSDRIYESINKWLGKLCW